MTIDKTEIKRINGMKKVLFQRHYPGYFYCKELIEGRDHGCKDFEIVSCYSDYNGQYMGDARMARILCKKMGIRQVQLAGDGNCCSIGFNEGEKKWYGWSHRAVVGFGIGDMLFAEKWIKSENTPFVKCGKVKIKTLAQAKLAAKRFAQYVS